MHAGLCPYGKEVIPEPEMGITAHGTGPVDDAEHLNVMGRWATLFLMPDFKSRTKFPI